MRATARQHQRHSNADKPPREHDDAPDDGPLNYIQYSLHYREGASTNLSSPHGTGIGLACPGL